MSESCNIEVYPEKGLQFKQDEYGILRELKKAPILSQDVQNIQSSLTTIRGEAQKLLSDANVSQEIIDIILSNTVIVVHRNVFGKLSYGTGGLVNISGKKIIVTAGHVINGMDNGTTKAFNGGVVGVFRLGDSSVIDLKQTYLDKKTDLGIIFPQDQSIGIGYEIPENPKNVASIILVGFKGHIKDGIHPQVQVSTTSLGYLSKIGIWLKGVVGSNQNETNILYLPHIATPGNSGALVVSSTGEPVCHITGSFLNVVDNCELSQRVFDMYMNYMTLKLRDDCN